MICSSPGLILKIFPYSNTSIICHAFTQEHGRLNFIAKGIRKPKNPLLSILQPFNLIDFQYYYKKNRSMQLIKEADIVASFNHIRKDLSTIIMSGAILNIINKTFEDEYPHEIIFRLIHKTLGNLSQNHTHNKISFIFFLFHLSKQLGFMPNIDLCINCNGLFKNDAIFSANSSSLVCVDCNIHQTSDADMVVNYEILVLLTLINQTHIKQISDLDVSNQSLIALYAFLIFFMKTNIPAMHNIKGLSELTKLYHA